MKLIKKPRALDEKISFSAYLALARPVQWLKNLLLLQGFLAGYYLLGLGSLDTRSFVFAVISTCLIASSNYILNELLDADTDQFHPTKKNRALVNSKLNKGFIQAEYLLCLFIGLALASLVNIHFFATEVFFAFSGLLYNVKPLRVKDIAVLDVLCEGMNNTIRFLLGWFAMHQTWSPLSLVMASWMLGAFLMSIKRRFEIEEINSPELAKKYRKSFAHYTEVRLISLSAAWFAAGLYCLSLFLRTVH